MASVNLELSPFAVPTEVSIRVPGGGKREDGIQAAMTMKLAQLDEETLAALCEEFTTAVFAAAGKSL